MPTPTSPVDNAPNLLLGSVGVAGDQSRVFEGEPRTKALAMLASAVAEQRLMAAMQIVNKDPSLVFETLQMPLRGTTGGQTLPVEFPLACLRAGMSAGYVFAVSHGFAVDTLMQNDSVTLLQEALNVGGGGRGCESDLSLLLSMGASHRAMPNHEALYSVVAAAFPPKSEKHATGALSMLLDAKVDFAYPSEYKCPYSVMVAAHGWTNPDIASSLTRMMARFVRAGLGLGRATGFPAQTALQRALGSKNGEAVVSLIRLGAKSGPDDLNGRDLFQLMDAQGLEQFKPAVQAALMESHISQSTAKTSTPAAAAIPAGEAVSLRRRRMGVI